MIKIKPFVRSNDWDSLRRIRAQNPAGSEVSLAVGGRSSVSEGLQRKHENPGSEHHRAHSSSEDGPPGASGKC